MGKKKRTAGQLASLAAVNEKKRRTVPEASSASAPADSGTDPPPAGRCRRSCRTPTAQGDGHCSYSRCSGRRDGDWWKSCHSMSTSPTRREATRTRRSSLPPDVCSDAHGTHAQLAPDCAVAVGQAAAAASAAPITPSTSAAQQPASPVRPLSACHCTRPSHAHAHARPAFDPASTAAVRQCRIG